MEIWIKISGQALLPQHSVHNATLLIVVWGILWVIWWTHPSSSGLWFICLKVHFPGPPGAGHGRPLSKIFWILFLSSILLTPNPPSHVDIRHPITKLPWKLGFRHMASQASTQKIWMQRRASLGTNLFASMVAKEFCFSVLAGKGFSIHFEMSHCQMVFSGCPRSEELSVAAQPSGLFLWSFWRFWKLHNTFQ